VRCRGSGAVEGCGVPVRVHGTDLRFGDAARSWLVSPMNALWQAIHCLGRRTLRFSHRRVMFEWPTTLAIIETRGVRCATRSALRRVTAEFFATRRFLRR